MRVERSINRRRSGGGTGWLYARRRRRPTPVLLQPQASPEEDTGERDEERRTDLDGWEERVGDRKSVV